MQIRILLLFCLSYLLVTINSCDHSTSSDEERSSSLSSSSQRANSSESDTQSSCSADLKSSSALISSSSALFSSQEKSSSSLYSSSSQSALSSSSSESTEESSSSQSSSADHSSSSPFDYKTLTDSRDGQQYKTIRIGNQVWMAENLAYLPQVDQAEDGSEDASSAQGKYYYVYRYTPTGSTEQEEVSNAKATDYFKTYGVLYNWHAALDNDNPSSASPSGVQGVCPAGWHLPSKAEWDTLTIYVNSYETGDVGYKLKATILWYESYGPGSDAFGFSALPGGSRSPVDLFTSMTYVGNWWTATEKEETTAELLYIYNHYGALWSDGWEKSFGLSVRCVQNMITP